MQVSVSFSALQIITNAKVHVHVSDAYFTLSTASFVSTSYIEDKIGYSYSIARTQVFKFLTSALSVEQLAVDSSCQ